MGRSKLKNLKIGCEIECIINLDKVGFIKRGEYHSGMNLKNQEDKRVENWSVERDCSISAGDRFKNYKQVEFVSGAFTSKKKFFKGINLFIKTLSCNGKYKLKEVLEINESCGCHIHFSNGKKNFNKIVHSFFYEKMRKGFFDILKKSRLSNQLKTAVKQQYDRSFAEIQTKEEFKENRLRCNERHAEFNFISERENKGLEWRSFNLNKVESWEEMRILFGIAFNSLNPLIMDKKKWKKGNLYKIDYSPPKNKKTTSKMKIKSYDNEKTKIIIRKPSVDEVIIALKKGGIKTIQKITNEDVKMKNNLWDDIGDLIKISERERNNREREDEEEEDDNNGLGYSVEMCGMGIHPNQNPFERMVEVSERLNRERGEDGHPQNIPHQRFTNIVMDEAGEEPINNECFFNGNESNIERALRIAREERDREIIERGGR